MLYITSSDLFEFEISGDIGRDENVGKLAISHQELGHEIDGPVIEATIFLPRFLTFAVVAILLEEL